MIAQIAELFTVAISLNLLRSALEILRTDRFIGRSGDGNKRPYTYRLTHEGILMVERSISNKGSDLNYFDQHGDEALEDVAGPDAIFLLPADRLNEDAWVPLQIDRDDPEYVRVLDAVNDALDKIRGDNGYAAHRPEERSGIIAAIEDGLDWLKNRVPSKGIIQAKLLDPFRFVASQFARTVIGEAAKSAIHIITTWLSHL